MRIMVPCKRVPDPDQRLSVAAGGRQIDTRNLTYIINPFDAIALEEALRLRDGLLATAEILAVAIGPEECDETLRTALAMGADRGLRVAATDSVDPWNVAQLLSRVVQAEQVKLVLLGKQAVDDDANLTGQFLAAILGWPQATFASRIEPLENDEFRVERETDLGLETIRVRLPAVISADLRLNEPRYASLPSIIKARKKTIEVHSLDQLQYELHPRWELLQLTAVTSARQCQRVSDAAALVDRLRADGHLSSDPR